MIDYEKVSVIGRINRFFGQVDVAELNSFSDMVHALWLQHVKQGWALYLYTDDVSGADIGYLFGCKEDWKSVHNMSHYNHTEDVFSLFVNLGVIFLKQHCLIKKWCITIR